MFTQIFQAVENLSTPSTDEPRQPSSSSRSKSIDSQLRIPSGQLAESALVNLRKSLVSQRPGSPALPKVAGVRDHKSPKSTLEDRLRAAAFAIGEASNPSSSVASARVSPTPPNSEAQRPPSPHSIPLPESPKVSLEIQAAVPLVTSTVSSVTTPAVQLSPCSPQRPRSTEITAPTSESTHPLSVDESSATTDPAQDSPEAVLASHPSSTGVEGLQERLKQVEQRFTDVSTSFKKLQAEKAAADLVVRELTPLESAHDDVVLRDYLQSMSTKTENLQREVDRLNHALERQEERINELRDIHRLESASQSDQIEQLRIQLNEAEALLKAAEGADSIAEEAATKQKAEIDQLQQEVANAKAVAKEEEEKRVKAISLLKTVRQKLVKAEKERDDLLREAASLRETERSEKDRDQVEMIKLRSEIDEMKVEKEKALDSLKTQFDRELANIKEGYEKEISMLRGQLELEVVTLKHAHAKELSSKTVLISTLENSLNNVTRDKNSFFDELQLRQAEVESAQSHLESLQSQNTELQYQLRETNDRCTLLKDELAEVRREHENRSREPLISAGEVARLLSAAEVKYESKISDLKRNLRALEKERSDGEAEWSRKLRDKVREVDQLKKEVGSAANTREHEEEAVAGMRAEINRLQDESRLLHDQLSQLRLSDSKVRDIEKLGRARELELNEKISALEQQIEESRSRETQLRLNNKTIREELRKVQSSAALLERQRNPGVGYWSNNSTDTRTSISSDPPSRVASPAPASLTQTTNDEEINLEYLRNVILQFLEHKEMRPSLVKVLSIILRFTPQETRRLIAKV